MRRKSTNLTPNDIEWPVGAWVRRKLRNSIGHSINPLRQHDLGGIEVEARRSDTPNMCGAQISPCSKNAAAIDPSTIFNNKS